ncbi:MAG: hypothetical protein M0R51_10890 [Clostridia bacterium]|jgi:hypothetical protein|nr:hypothetical protein [Clostridia bacterium]
MQIDVKKLTKEEMQIRIILLKAMIRANKREIKRLITDKKPEEAILLTLKTDDMKEEVKVLERGIE